VNDLREHLHELADAAARHGTTSGPAAAIRRGRQRRRRMAGAVAAVIALVVAIGSGTLGRLAPGPAGDRARQPPAPPAHAGPPQRLARTAGRGERRRGPHRPGPPLPGRPR
jgi:hypothetical protein